MSRLLPMSMIAVLLAVPPVAAQQSSPNDLGVLSGMVGHWQGEAWSMRPGGRLTVRQHEYVRLEAGGTVIAVRGLGILTSGAQEDTVHHAFAVIHQNHDRTGSAMRAFTAEGNWLDPDIEITGNGYTWRMHDARVGDIRYEMSLDDQGRWVENGYVSRNGGNNWIHFLGMVLEKQR